MEAPNIVQCLFLLPDRQYRDVVGYFLSRGFQPGCDCPTCVKRVERIAIREGEARRMGIRRVDGI
jgi:hypothetical protein